MRYLLIVATLLIGGCGSHPSDDDLRELYLKNRADLAEIRRMALEDDGLWRVDDNWIGPKGHISDERIAEYRQIFSRIGLERGFQIDPRTGETNFLFSAQGLATGGSTKGIRYAEEPCSQIYRNLDRRPPDLPSLETGCVPIEGDWSIFYTWDD